MCTMVFTDTISYYFKHWSSVFGTIYIRAKRTIVFIIANYYDYQLSVGYLRVYQNFSFALRSLCACAMGWYLSHLFSSAEWSETRRWR